MAPALQERDTALRQVEGRLRAAAAPPPDAARLRAALEQRTAEWKEELRTDPQVARLLLRRLVGPLELHDDRTRPDWVDWVEFEAPAMPEALLDGLVHHVASPTGTGASARLYLDGVSDLYVA